MDWVKWREEQDALQRELDMEKKLREMLGIANRTPAQFWFDIITTGAFLIVLLLFCIVAIPWLIELYRNDPTLFPRGISPLKRHAPEIFFAYAVLVFVGFGAAFKK